MVAAEHPNHPRPPEPACVFGRVPSRADFVRRGTPAAPEHLLQAWLSRATGANGALPAHGVRFAAAPAGVAMLGVWIPSCDASGSPHPLVFVRRAPPYVCDLAWPLRLPGCSSFLDAAQLGLMVARQGELDLAWSWLEALAWPLAAELDAMRIDARSGLEHAAVATFARRIFPAASRPAATLDHTLRRLAPRAAPRAETRMALPARDEFDLFVWLELVRAQRSPGAAPRAVFWTRADALAIVCFDDPQPDVLRLLTHRRAPDLRPEPAPQARQVDDAGLCSRGSIAELSRALALGGASLPLEAFASMPPPLTSRT